MPLAQALVDESTFQQHKALFLAFLQSPQGQACRSTLRLLANQDLTQRLLISLNDLRSFDYALAHSVMHRPLLYYAPWEEATRQWAQQHRGVQSGHSSEEHIHNSQRGAGINIGFVGNFGSRTVTPRELRSKKLGEHVCVIGIITHCSLAMPKILRSVHWCQDSQEHITRDFRDATCLDSWIASSAYKGFEDADIHGGSKLRIIKTLRTQRQSCDGQSLQAEFGLGTYADHQCLTLQELPEAAPLGQLPRSVFSRVQDLLLIAT